MTRMKMFEKRKSAQVDAMNKLLVRLSNRAKYILDVLAGDVDLRKKTNQQINDLLVDRGFTMIDGDFKYLIKMPMDSVSEENVDRLNIEHKDKTDELYRIKETTVQQMWLSELDNLEQEYSKYREERNQSGDKKQKQGSKLIAKAGSVKKMVKKTKGSTLDLVEE
jgi:DNA topoisomerase-2